MNTRALINQVAGSDQDFEWYPTTNEIIETIKADIEDLDQNWSCHPSVLDCGAGDGRVLMALTEGDQYAIEKSRPLLDAMDKGIFIVGTDFHQQTLIDKKVGIVFSNPPYSEYEQWAVKIIREANAGHVYLVIPERWEKCKAISEAIDARNAKHEVIGKFDFLEADRAARAKIHIVRIDHRYCENPFSLWFEDNFKLAIADDKASKYEIFNRTKESVEARAQTELVAGSDLVQILESLYQRDLAELMENYKALETINPVLMRELDVNVSSVKKALQMKVENLKDVYWKEFFERMEKITRRLTAKNRENMLKKLQAHTHIDFTTSNAYAVSVWAIKNANGYFDSQLVETFEKLIDMANIVNYKSNQRTFKKEDWKWNQKPSGLENFGLEYRVVIESWTGGFSSERYESSLYGGLKKNTCEYLQDLRTIADNLGYSVDGFPGPEQFSWERGKQEIFHCKDIRAGKEKELMRVRVYQNGNIHIKFDQDFMCRFNVEFGRLKGWLKDHHQAAEELSVPIELAAESFGSNIRLESSAVALIGITNQPREPDESTIDRQPKEGKDNV